MMKVKINKRLHKGLLNKVRDFKAKKLVKLYNLKNQEVGMSLGIKTLGLLNLRVQIIQEVKVKTCKNKKPIKRISP